MSSIGASFSHIYVQQNRQKEKMKRKEEERVKRGEADVGERLFGSNKRDKIKKIHPTEFSSLDLMAEHKREKC
ncbi:hypothetical protein LguiB_016390 [Lonicera macranthoides]